MEQLVQELTYKPREGTALMRQSRVRQDYIDIAKGLGCLLVVFGHALEMYFNARVNWRGPSAYADPAFHAWKYIYSFHMPLFYFLSGLAARSYDRIAFHKVFADALFLVLLATLVQLLFAPLRLILPMPGDALPGGLLDAAAYVVKPAIKMENYAIVVMWFLPSLAFVRLAAWYVANATVLAACLALGVLCAFYAAALAFEFNYFEIRSAFLGLGFFVLGQRLGKTQISARSGGWHWTVFLAGLAVTLLTYDANRGCFWAMSDSCPDLGYGDFAVIAAIGKFGFAPLFILTSLAGIALVLAASLTLARSRSAKPLVVLGRHTLEVLVINGIAFVFVEPHLAPHIDTLPPLGPIVLFALFQVLVVVGLHPYLAAVLTYLQEVAARCASVALLQAATSRKS